MSDKQITQLELVTQWMQYTIENEQELLNILLSSNRKILVNSFQSAIVSNDPDKVISATLRFNHYLRFLDMGVGRGVPIGSRKTKSDFERYRNSRGQLHKYKRKKIPVYNKPITYQTNRLMELLCEHFNITTISAIDNALTKKDGIDLKF